MVMRRPPRMPKQPHRVAWKDTHFEVVSGNSGAVYRVVQDGNELLCPCEGFKQRRKCSHCDAVVEELERMVGERKEADSDES